MEGKQWIISDVVKQTGIEPHVLRYWEKELHLNIPRNEFGHRYYLDKHIELFRQIHTMKEGGFQLKAILTLIPPEFLSEEYKQVAQAGEENVFANMAANGMSQNMQHKGSLNDNGSASNIIIMNKKNDRFEVLSEKDSLDDKQVKKSEIQNNEKTVEPLGNMKEIIKNDNTEYVETDKITQFKDILSDVMLEVLEARDQKMGVQISEKVIKQMDYLMRLQEEFEEERFKRLDETIRMYQKEREAVGKQKQSRHIFFKKKSRS